ncbi:hypothetical protein HED50_15295 [Ochrobactrum oryzae]|nr:hypothetical protein [Brucella oryzae]
MKIGLFGQFGSGNTGNDGSLEAMLHQLQRTDPQIEVICICSGPEAVKTRMELRLFPLAAMSLPIASCGSWIGFS